VTRVFALIIAGGEGSRLGHVRKGELRVGGERMIDRVARAFAGIEGPLLVSTGRRRECPLPAPAVALPDSTDRASGPLAALRAASTHLATRAAPRDILVAAAVDTPFLPADYVLRLVAAVETAEAAYAAWGDGFYPTSSAWRLESLAKALKRLDVLSGPKAALGLVEAARVDWTKDAAQNPFANANSLADLIALQRRAVTPERPRHRPS